MATVSAENKKMQVKLHFQARFQRTDPKN